MLELINDVISDTETIQLEMNWFILLRKQPEFERNEI